MTRPRFSILSLMLLTAVIAVGAMLYQRHLAWKEAEVRYRALIHETAWSREVIEEVRQLVIDYPQLAQEKGTLEWVLRSGNVELCRALLENGADPDEKGTVYVMPPLQQAIVAKQIEPFRLLLDFGADKFALDDAPKGTPTHGNTLLHLAAALNRPAHCQILLEEGLSVDATNAMGQTPLHLAIRGAHLDVIKLLLEHGTKCLPDQQGQTPREVAQRTREDFVLAHLDLEPIDEMIRLLEEHCPVAPEPTQAVQP